MATSAEVLPNKHPLISFAKLCVDAREQRGGGVERDNMQHAAAADFHSGWCELWLCLHSAVAPFSVCLREGASLGGLHTLHRSSLPSLSGLLSRDVPDRVVLGAGHRMESLPHRLAVLRESAVTDRGGVFADREPVD